MQIRVTAPVETSIHDRARPRISLDGPDMFVYRDYVCEIDLTPSPFFPLPIGWVEAAGGLRYINCYVSLRIAVERRSQVINYQYRK